MLPLFPLPHLDNEIPQLLHPTTSSISCWVFLISVSWTGCSKSGETCSRFAIRKLGCLLGMFFAGGILVCSSVDDGERDLQCLIKSILLVKKSVVFHTMLNSVLVQVRKHKISLAVSAVCILQFPEVCQKA